MQQYKNLVIIYLYAVFCVFAKVFCSVQLYDGNLCVPKNELKIYCNLVEEYEKSLNDNGILYNTQMMNITKNDWPVLKKNFVTIIDEVFRNIIRFDSANSNGESFHLYGDSTFEQNIENVSSIINEDARKKKNDFLEAIYNYVLNPVGRDLLYRLYAKICVTNDALGYVKRKCSDIERFMQQQSIDQQSYINKINSSLFYNLIYKKFNTNLLECIITDGKTIKIDEERFKKKVAEMKEYVLDEIYNNEQLLSKKRHKNECSIDVGVINTQTCKLFFNILAVVLKSIIEQLDKRVKKYKIFVKHSVSGKNDYLSRGRAHNTIYLSCNEIDCAASDLSINSCLANKQDFGVEIVSRRQKVHEIFFHELSHHHNLVSFDIVGEKIDISVYEQLRSVFTGGKLEQYGALNSWFTALQKVNDDKLKLVCGSIEELRNIFGIFIVEDGSGAKVYFDPLNQSNFARHDGEKYWLRYGHEVTNESMPSEFVKLVLTYVQYFYP